MIKIRRATIEDEAKVTELLKDFLSSENIDRETGVVVFQGIVKKDEKGTIFVAELDGNVVGVITQSYPVAIHRGGKYSCIEEFIVSE